MPTENIGTQVRTWIPDDQYGVIRELAAARHTSISQIVRELIDAGLQRDAMTAAANQALSRVTTALDHLERLTFFIAQNATYTAVAGERAGQAAAAKLFPNDPERAEEQLRSARGEILGIVHERIRKALRGPNPVREPEQREDEDNHGEE